MVPNDFKILAHAPGNYVIMPQRLNDLNESYHPLVW